MNLLLLLFPFILILKLFVYYYSDNYKISTVLKKFVSKQQDDDEKMVAIKDNIANKGTKFHFYINEKFCFRKI